MVIFHSYVSLPEGTSYFPCLFPSIAMYHHSPSSSGWWLTYPSEKYELVSWDYYSQLNGKNKSHVPNHQPVMVYIDVLMVYHGLENPSTNGLMTISQYIWVNYNISLT